MTFPVGRHVDAKKVKLYLDGKMFADIDIQIDYVNPCEYVYYDVSDFAGKEIEIEVEPDIGYQGIQTDERSHSYGDHSNFRPMIHFTPEYGWINDPNGLLEYTSPVTGQKTYHMFFQHNPYGTRWGNMHWGHATSTDLFHWKQQPNALYPDETGTMFSGSAIVDKYNRSGLKEGEEDVILLFYTSAGGTSSLSEGQQFTQCLAYSTDGGITFKKYEKNPVVPHIQGGNRDPKVTWCEEIGRYVMALYLDGSTFAILASDDFLEWELIQEIVIEGEAECPDIYPLNADGDPEKRKWVISGASHRYVVCECKNRRFNVIQHARTLNYGRSSYASQTFSDVSDGRRISIAWNCELTFPEAPFSGQMSIPMEMSLRTHESEYILTVKPVRELESLKKDERVYENVEISQDKPFAVELEQSAYLIDMDLTDISKSKVQMRNFGKDIDIEPEFNHVRVGDSVLPLSITSRPGKLLMIVDTCSIELISGDGEAMMTAPLVCDYSLRRMSISAETKNVIKRLSVARLAL